MQIQFYQIRYLVLVLLVTANSFVGIQQCRESLQSWVASRASNAFATSTHPFILRGEIRGNVVPFYRNGYTIVPFLTWQLTAPTELLSVLTEFYFHVAITTIIMRINTPRFKKYTNKLEYQQFISEWKKKKQKKTTESCCVQRLQTKDKEWEGREWWSGPSKESRSMRI